MSYIQSLPRTDAPEVFGLHENANISAALNESNALLATLLLMQPRGASAAAGYLSASSVVLYSVDSS